MICLVCLCVWVGAGRQAKVHDGGLPSLQGDSPTDLPGTEERPSWAKRRWERPSQNLCSLLLSMKWLTSSCTYRSGQWRAGQQRGWLGGGDHRIFYQRRNHSTWRSVVRYAGEIVPNAELQKLPAVHLFHDVDLTALLSSVHPCLCGRRRGERRHWLVDNDHAVNL